MRKELDIISDVRARLSYTLKEHTGHSYRYNNPKVLNKSFNNKLNEDDLFTYELCRKITMLDNIRRRMNNVK